MKIGRLEILKVVSIFKKKQFKVFKTFYRQIVFRDFV